MMLIVINAVKISLICFMFIALGEPEMIFDRYQRLISNLPLWLNKPLGGCGYCFTGQVSLWYFVITKPFNLIELLFFVSLSIFLIKIYDIIWNCEQ
jgi:hypothetical protein